MDNHCAHLFLSSEMNACALTLFDLHGLPCGHHMVYALTAWSLRGPNMVARASGAWLTAVAALPAKCKTNKKNSNKNSQSVKQKCCSRQTLTELDTPPFDWMKGAFRGASREAQGRIRSCEGSACVLQQPAARTNHTKTLQKVKSFTKMSWKVEKSEKRSNKK